MITPELMDAIVAERRREVEEFRRGQMALRHTSATSRTFLWWPLAQLRRYMPGSVDPASVRSSCLG